MSDFPSSTNFRPATWVVQAVQKNPEGLLLLAAGCALLLRGRSSSVGGHLSQQYQADDRQHREKTGQMQREPRQMQDEGGPGKEWGIPERISQAAEEARSYASNVGKAAAEKTRSFAAAAGAHADNARNNIVDGSGHIVQQAQSTFQRVVEEQPFAVAIAGLAAGAAVAAAFPVTRLERETLGEAGSRVSEAASTVGERLSEAASATGERLRTVAEEKGLNAGGLKEVARDVAGTFGNSLTGREQGEESDQGRQGIGGASQSDRRSASGTERTASTTATPRSSSNLAPGFTAKPKTPGQ
jgi:hypothetical protein